MTALSPTASPRALLADLYWAAVTAAAPGPALSAALASDPPESKRRVHILALGKAAYPMAVAAVGALRAHGRDPAGGLLVTPAPAPAPHPALGVAVGDHPRPGAGSLAAAEAVEAAASRVQPDDEVWVLLSGGTTSLVGAPVPGISGDELSLLYDLLLGSGLDIAAMNRIRKRFTRWSGGRLAARLVPACVKNFTISDVIGDDLASIGSGPCVPDDSFAAEVRTLLTSAGLWERIPDSMCRLLTAVERGERPETPKPGAPAFHNTKATVVASNRLALAAASARADALGFTTELVDTALAGEASLVGERLARTSINYAQTRHGAQGRMHKDAVLIWGGETTVTLGPNPGPGGRSQELALAAAGVMSAETSPAEGAITLLAAGTDGRDGPTDAAGAMVDASTWAAIRAAGRDPAQDLFNHQAYHALDAAGALFRTGLTGTNVMDLVMAVVKQER